MTRSLFRNKRGVGEVIASLMMVLIVSVAGVIVYSYSLGTSASSSSFFQLEASQKEERARERFSIIAVWWDTVSQLNLTVLNYGKIELVIDAVYINGTAVSTYSSGDGVPIGTGELICVRFTSPVPIVNRQTYEILAVSRRGSKNVVFWKA